VNVPDEHLVQVKDFGTALYEPTGQGTGEINPVVLHIAPAGQGTLFVNP
jgi:hypothetical protein